MLNYQRVIHTVDGCIIPDSPTMIAFNGVTSVKKKLFLNVCSLLNDGYVSQTILNPHFPMVFHVFRGEKSHFPRLF